MGVLRNALARVEPAFKEGGSLEALYPLFEATETILFTPAEVTKGAVHVRDAMNLKRMMIVVVAALTPCLVMALYNTGYQANWAITHGGAVPLDNWQEAIYQALGLAYAPDLFNNLIHGAIYFLPIFAMTFFIGGNIEVIFALVRKHEINEGFLVTGFLFPLTLPPTIPLWQVAMGIAFGVIIGKEVFGGTGMNILNPALTARAFLFFAYPAQLSGNTPWIAAHMPDAGSGATFLGRFAEGMAVPPVGGERWLDAFYGIIPGSMGETSALACILGLLVLVGTRVASWRTMAGVVAGATLTAGALNLMGSDTNPMMNLPIYWHLVVGGLAFGMVFMATDPVSSAFTDRGKLIYGAGIGTMVVLVRVVNPAYPEGMMLAILFMNMVAPFIDYFFIRGNIKRRVARHGA